MEQEAGAWPRPAEQGVSRGVGHGMERGRWRRLTAALRRPGSAEEVGRRVEQEAGGGADDGAVDADVLEVGAEEQL
ncbi:MAG: hypothetical protein QOG82_2359 [Actinomycetota bacterium]|nr:hypothetical protein [Actinomycetota bacterium]